MNIDHNNTHKLIDFECSFGQKLAKKFGDNTAREIISFLQVEGLPIEFPAKMVDGITLSGSPELKLELLDAQGSVIDANNKGIAHRHRFLVAIDGKPQLTLKSIKIPKLDYNKTDYLKVKLTYYCMAERNVELKEKK